MLKNLFKPKSAKLQSLPLTTKPQRDRHPYGDLDTLLVSTTHLVSILRINQTVITRVK